jgi:DMSO/TMAO reductase YedYZ molybdopterin-dependent catalytic subunit
MPADPDDLAATDRPVVHPARPAWRNAGIGAASVAAALGAQELAAGLIGWFPSLMEGAAAWVIDVAPAAVVEWAIHTLEGWTKRTLIIGISTVLVVAGILTSGLPTSARRSVFAVVGLAGAIATANGSPGIVPSIMNALVAIGVGLGVDAWLRRPVPRPIPTGAPEATPTPAQAPTADRSRRAFLVSVGAIAGVAVAAAVGGRQLIERSIRKLARRDEVVLPAPVQRVPPVVTSVHEFAVEGLEPVVTPNERFFTVDINALSPPEIDLTDWKLTVTGMVDREITIEYADLLAMNLVEKYATLSCVSNKVGGRLVGNAVWLGVPFSEILERAGAHPTAEQVAATGADGFSTGFPLAAVYDRDTILAIGMNGEPLPYRHGFPARLVVPGYYGFVSAAKWVERVELTTWDDHDSYWVKLGWAKYAPVETQSRIDAPRDRMTFATGPRMIAGVAWAPFLGISRVEVRIDDGPWLDAEVSEPLGEATWVQWQLPWDASPGEHVISVRATDGDGVIQTATERSPIPNGATGHHTIRVRAE